MPDQDPSEERLRRRIDQALTYLEEHAAALGPEHAMALASLLLGAIESPALPWRLKVRRAQA